METDFWSFATLVAIVTVASTALKAVGDLVLNRFKPRVDEALLDEHRAKIKLAAVQAEESLRKRELDNGAARAASWRVIQQATNELVELQRQWVVDRDKEIDQLEKDVLSWKTLASQIEERAKKDRDELLGQMALERSRVGEALDNERKQRIALADELRTAQEEIRGKTERLEQALQDNGALRRTITLLRGGGEGPAS